MFQIGSKIVKKFLNIFQISRVLKKMLKFKTSLMSYVNSVVEKSKSVLSTSRELSNGGLAVNYFVLEVTVEVGEVVLLVCNLSVARMVLLLNLN